MEFGNLTNSSFEVNNTVAASTDYINLSNVTTGMLHSTMTSAAG